MYHYVERLGFVKNDNCIDYEVGPIKISLHAYTEKITIETNTLWLEELKNFMLAIQCMLEIKNTDIIYVTETKVEIKLSYKSIKKYLTYVIIFINLEKKENTIKSYKERIIEINNDINIDPQI